MTLRGVLVIVGLLTMVAPPAVSAQGVDGYVSLFVDAFPDVTLPAGDRDAVSELRARLFAERRFDVTDRFRFTAAGFAEGLIGDRHDSRVTRAGKVRPQELHVEAIWQKADLRVGLTRVVWGRLDEFLPTDVVNPLDLTRFFFEGRAEARLPVGMVRARWLPSEQFTLEGIYVPVFRRGRFDQLDETTSPFNVGLRIPGLTIDAREPRLRWNNAQGGARASVTTGRVDWSLSTYHGFEAMPTYNVAGASLVEVFPRYTMFGGDFETVRGPWGLRGEVAAFKGRKIEGGVGLDRKAGAYRVSSNVIVTRQYPTPALSVGRTDTTIVGSLDRSFARETRTIRAFAVYNPAEQSAFVRVISVFNLRDNVAVEASGGWFTGAGPDQLSRLSTRDFVYARLKVFY